jgi:hypothetical protein
MTRLFVPGVTRDDEEPSYVCTVPVADGEICGRCWYDGEERAYQAHVGRCAREHMDQINRERLAARAPAFDEETWDPEIAEHMRKVGERMLKEGRLTVNPNERAGF